MPKLGKQPETPRFPSRSAEMQILQLTSVQNTKATYNEISR